MKRNRSLIFAISILALAAACRAALTTNIEYGVADGVSLKLDAWAPDDASKPMPVAIIVHGGGWSGGDKAKDITPLFKPISDAGFIWFSINYRMAPANRWPDCLVDVQTAIRWAKAHAAEYHGDPSRIILVGHSAGGHLVCLAAELADASTQVQGVIGCAPVTDMEQDLAQRGGLSTSLQALLNRPKEVTDESRKILHDISPINHINPGLPPFLILQGSVDKTVQPIQSSNFQAKMKLVENDCTLISVQDAPHAITSWDKTDTSWEGKLTDWLTSRFASTRPSNAE